MSQLGAGPCAGELSVDLALVGVEDVEVIDASVQGLPSQRGELDLGDVQPGPVFGRVMDLESFGQAARLDRVESLVLGNRMCGC